MARLNAPKFTQFITEAKSINLALAQYEQSIFVLLYHHQQEAQLMLINPHDGLVGLCSKANNIIKFKKIKRCN